MVERLSVRLMNPWSAYQVLIILGLIALSYLVYRIYKPRIRALLGAPHGWPKWMLRILALTNQRLWLLIFVILSWCTLIIMQEVTWPSRSYFVGLAALLATGLFVIAIATRMIRNKALRKMVKWMGWIFITLEVLNLRETVTNALEVISLQTGDTKITALTVLTAILTLGILFVSASFLSRVGAARINQIEDMSPSIRVLLIKVLQLTLFITAFLICLRAIGFDLGNLALISGAVGLGIGFGLQKIVSNLVSGVIILLDKSIKPGDVISLDNTFGWITQLGARYTSVLTRDGREHLIPNEDFITSQVINWSHSSDLVRLDIHFGVAYDSDPHEVKRIAAAAPLTVKRVVKSPAPVCHMVNMGDSSIDFVLRFWIGDTTAGLTNVRGDNYLALWDALKANNIDIPFPRRDVQILPSSAADNPLPSD
ncbi:MAG: mechanosensitive ion channel [Rhodobacteraceae bacterium]|nr:mechanosensitive ion channel [Paracoccaceae bacterium]